MRFTIVAGGLSALWLAFPAISLPTPAARTTKRFAIETRDAITRSHSVLVIRPHHRSEISYTPGKNHQEANCGQDDEVAKRQWSANYAAAPSDDLGTNAQISNAQISDTPILIPPDWWLQSSEYRGRGSGREIDKWPQVLDLMAMFDERGSGRRGTTPNLNGINPNINPF